MKVIIKTVKGEAFPIEVEPDTTIKQVKIKIQEIKGFDIDTQKLIIKGKSLSDEQTIQTAGISEGNFMVVMTQKKQQQSQQQQLQQQPQQQPLQQLQQQSQQQQQQPQQQDMLGSNVNEELVNNIMNMGFPKDDVVRALKAAFGNGDRAIEYLISGIPEIPQQHSNSQQNLPMPGLDNSDQQQQQPSQFEEEEDDEDSNNLAFLADNPMFQQIRAAIRQNPNILQALLPQIAQSNPQLFQLINSNPEAFMQLLEDDSNQGEQMPSNVISVTEEEKAAIDRLSDLGFDKHLALEAYLACDKNEELAANYLFDAQLKGDFQMEEEEEEFLQSQQQQQSNQQQQQNQNDKQKDKQKENDDEDHAFS